MSYEYAVATALICELSAASQLPHERRKKLYRKTLRDVKRHGQTRRIPVAIHDEVVGEFDLFHALQEVGFVSIEIIRLFGDAREPAVNAAQELSAMFPIREHTDPYAVKDALRMIEHDIQPSEDLGHYLSPLIACFAE